MAEGSANKKWQDDEATARSSSTQALPNAVSPPSHRAARVPPPSGSRNVPARHAPREWDRARWLNEVRRFETVWEVDAPSVRAPSLAPPPAEHVTLVIYEWQNAEPGVLSWQFADSNAAVTAARALRNAVRWAVLTSPDFELDLERARALGLVVAEKND